jgi:hypothetical protein
MSISDTFSLFDSIITDETIIDSHKSTVVGGVIECFDAKK